MIILYLPPLFSLRSRYICWSKDWRIHRRVGDQERECVSIGTRYFPIQRDDKVMPSKTKYGVLETLGQF
jgi:hypothetical protein